MPQGNSHGVSKTTEISNVNASVHIPWKQNRREQWLKCLHQYWHQVLPQVVAKHLVIDHSSSIARSCSLLQHLQPPNLQNRYLELYFHDESMCPLAYQCHVIVQIYRLDNPLFWRAIHDMISIRGESNVMQCVWTNEFKLHMERELNCNLRKIWVSPYFLCIVPCSVSR